MRENVPGALHPVNPNFRRPYFKYDGTVAIDAAHGTVIPTSHGDDWSYGTFDITPEGVYTFERDTVLTAMAINTSWDIPGVNNQVEPQVLYAGDSRDWYRLLRMPSGSPAQGETDYSPTDEILNMVHTFRAGDKLRLFVYGSTGSHITSASWEWQILMES